MAKKPASNRIDMTGNTYNSWKVVSYSHTDKKIAYWNCVCLQCDNQYMVSGPNMRFGLSKRCIPCGLKATANSNVGVSKAKVPEDLVFQYVAKAYRHGAKRRGFKYELTLDELKNIILKDCTYCGTEPSNKCYPMRGMKMTPENSERSIIRNGIDRVDSTKGYTIDNVVPCCHACNTAKMEMSTTDFMAWITKVYNHNK